MFAKQNDLNWLIAAGVILLFWRYRSSFRDFAGFDAAGTDAYTLAAACDFGFDGLQIRVPATPGGVVCVRDVVSELGTFTAEFTFLCHN